MSAYARRSARVLLLDAADRILLIRSALVPGQPAHGYAWFTPGGGVEPGEDLARAAARELHEEVGLAVAAADLRPIAYAAGQVNLDWATGLFRDDFFLCRVERHQVDTTRQTAFERENYGGHRWWTVPQLVATDEIIYPYGLVNLLTDTIAGRVPETPVRLPWHHR
jgi:8-oxo-dGTP pyrophosphatase MutT (NUDIX family)